VTAGLRVEEGSARYVAQVESPTHRQFELLATSERGIQRLRSLIVSSALSGRLTSQPGRSSPGFGNSWPVVRLTDLGPTFQNGASSRGDHGGLPTTVVRLADISEGEIKPTEPRVLPIRAFDRAKYALKLGDILVIRVNGSASLVGRFIVCRTDMDAIHCDHFIRMRFDPAVVCPEYLRLAGDSASVRERIASLFVSTAGQKTVNQGHIGSITIALPPIEEQRRIVARVEELMKLCDVLEQNGRLADEQHARLTSTLFDALAASESAHALAENWQRVAEHFDLLLDRPEAIDELERTILAVAMEGRLVRREPTEGPVASSFQSGVNAQQNPIDASELPFEIPISWRWVRLGWVAELINGDRGKNYPNRAEYVASGLPFVNAGHIEPDGTLSPDSMHYLTRKKFDSLRSGKMQAGDLLYCLRGALGKTAIVDLSEGAVASSLVIIRLNEAVDRKYAYYFLTGPLGRELIKRFDNGSAQPNLAANRLKRYVMPLPPLAEQSRIVARIEELRRLCSDLRQWLTQARQTQSRLADSLVAELA